jgi:hypothetical protein
MLKLYLQITLTLGSLSVGVLCMGWYFLTYLYTRQLMIAGREVLVNWELLVFVGALLCICAITFMRSVRWVVDTKKQQQSKMARYRRLHADLE